MFFNNLNKLPRTEISKDAPKKTGLPLLFDILSREFFTLISVNLLFIVCSLPIITIGASYSALNYVILKMVRDEPIMLLSDFKKGFKDNFKLGSIFMFLGIFFFGTGGFSVYFYNLLELSYGRILSIICMIFLVFLFFVSLYIFPILVSVELSFKNILRNSILLSIASAVKTIILALIIALIWVATVIYLPISLPIVLFFVHSIPALISLVFIYPQIEKYVIKK